MLYNLLRRPCKLQSMGCIRQRVPGQLQTLLRPFLSIACKPQSMLRTLQSMPRKLQSMPRKLQSMLRTLQSMPRTLQSMPRKLQSMPRTLQSMPRTLQSMPRILQSMTCTSGFVLNRSVPVHIVTIQNSIYSFSNSINSKQWQNTLG
jgi:hypothetical protein